jgi:hypothetical protein
VSLLSTAMFCRTPHWHSKKGAPQEAPFFILDRIALRELTARHTAQLE